MRYEKRLRLVYRHTTTKYQSHPFSLQLCHNFYWTLWWVRYKFYRGPGTYELGTLRRANAAFVIKFSIASDHSRAFLRLIDTIQITRQNIWGPQKWPHSWPKMKDIVIPNFRRHSRNFLFHLSNDFVYLHLIMFSVSITSPL